MYTMQGISREELRDIGISVLVYTVAFAIWSLRTGRLPSLPIYLIVIASFIVATSAFLLHEIAHRFVARNYGGVAAYRMWLMGALFALLSSAIGFLIAAVGAVYIQGVYDESRLGKISLAGPAVNEGLGIAFYVAAILVPAASVAEILGFVAVLNFWMGFFNLLPIPPLDGYKVWHWSREYYVVSIAVALGFLIFALY